MINILKYGFCNKVTKLHAILNPPNLIYRKFPTLLPNISLILHMLILLFTVCSVVNSVRASEKPLHQRARNSNFIYKPVIQENYDDDEEKK